MFEIPEFVTLARQINDSLSRKIIRKGVLGNKPHKFVWYNRTPDEFERLASGKTIGRAWTKGKGIPKGLDNVLPNCSPPKEAVIRFPLQTM